MREPVLIVSTLGYTIEAFLPPYIDFFLTEGFEVDCLANWNHQWNKVLTGANKLHLPFSRNPLSPTNYFLYKKIKSILNKKRYRAIYTHTPIASALVRLANRHRASSAPLIYEAHGFHFHQYGSRLGNFVYRTMEKILSSYSCAVITINEDDYRAAKELFQCPVHRVHGIGVDTGFFKPADDPDEIKKKLRLSPERFTIVTVADFIPRKNLQAVLALGERLKNKKINFQWFIIGQGPMFQKIKKDIHRLGLENNFVLTGFVNDLRVYYQGADCFVLLSLQEGLPRSLLEAGASGTPAVVTNIRGNRDLIRHGKNSFLVPGDQTDKALTYLLELNQNQKLRNDMGKALREKILKQYSIHRVISEHKTIFNLYLKGENNGF